MQEPVIQIRNLSKRYRIGRADHRSDTLLGSVLKGIQSPLNNLRRIRSLSTFRDDESDVCWALKEVSFDVQEGDVLGIIGHNGAGKSTLLKILSRITEPTSGEIRIRGRVASLLEIGTGFHPELTGRENIYMNGTLLGMRKHEIDKKFDEIVHFSGVDSFIDTPVKFYSSGMRVRLGFSVAAHLEPEILIIDEVLAVGDAEFQRKCLGKMEDVAKQGRTVLFVSHNMNAVQTLCEKSILLANGRVVLFDSSEKVVNSYLNKIGSKYSWTPPENEKNYDDLKEIIVKEVKCSHLSSISISDNFHIDVLIAVKKKQESLIHLNLFFKAQGETAFVACSQQIQPDIGDYLFRFFFPENLLNNLNYQVDLMVVKRATGIIKIREVLQVDLIDDRDIGWKGNFPGYLRPEIETKIERVSHE